MEQIHNELDRHEITGNYAEYCRQIALERTNRIAQLLLEQSITQDKS